MAPTDLFASGLRWSYRKYGLKGAAAFALLAVAGYYVAKRRVSRLFGGEDGASTDDHERIDLEDDGGDEDENGGGGEEGSGGA